MRTAGVSTGRTLVESDQRTLWEIHVDRNLRRSIIRPDCKERVHRLIRSTLLVPGKGLLTVPTGCIDHLGLWLY